MNRKNDNIYNHISIVDKIRIYVANAVIILTALGAIICILSFIQQSI